jgi:hypothetical protein
MANPIMVEAGKKASRTRKLRARARKAVATRQANAAKRSAAARKAWDTRRAS